MTNHATCHNRKGDFPGNLLDDARNQPRHEFNRIRLLRLGELEPTRDGIGVDEKESLYCQQSRSLRMLENGRFRRDNPIGADTFGEVIDPVPVEANAIDSLGVEEDRSIFSLQVRHITIERAERSHHEKRRRHIRP